MAAAGIALALTLAACGGTAGTSAPATHPPASSQAPAAGPFTVTLTYCGKLSTAQQTQFSTNGTAGAVVTAVNHGTAPYRVQVQAEFIAGTTVAGDNVTGYSALIGPGQSQQLEADQYPPPANPSDTCKLIGYAVQSASGSGLTGPFEGGWPLTGSMQGTK